MINQEISTNSLEPLHILNNNDIQNDLNDGNIKEKIIDAKSGACMLIIFLLSIFILIVAMIVIIPTQNIALIIPTYIIAIPVIILICYCFGGLFVNDINEAHVLTFFGEYLGTVKKTGFCFVNPLANHKTISLKSNNLNGAVIKVNDKLGNPIMMGCVVVWRVNDTAKAMFSVENYNQYVEIQSDCAVRDVGCQFPYESDNENEICLRSGNEEVSKVLVKELSERLKHAGIEVIEARITELSYANEIANVMLKRQAADAVIAARQKIVEGAVSIVGHALDSLNKNDICNMDREKKAKLVSNMLVVLCGDSQASSGGHSSSAPRLAEGFNKYG